MNVNFPELAMANIACFYGASLTVAIEHSEDPCALRLAIRDCVARYYEDRLREPVFVMACEIMELLPRPMPVFDVEYLATMCRFAFRDITPVTLRPGVLSHEEIRDAILMHAEALESAPNGTAVITTVAGPGFEVERDFLVISTDEFGYTTWFAFLSTDRYFYGVTTKVCRGWSSSEVWSRK